MIKEGITTDLLLTILEGLRLVIKEDPEIQIANVRIDFRDDPDLSKCGFVIVNYPYQNK